MTENIYNDTDKYCVKCGSIIDIHAVVCPQCACRQPLYCSKNKTAAALFAFFLGSFGIHKFYLGQNVAGIIYILLCWTFIPGLLGFIEGILYAMMTDQQFYDKYCLKYLK